MTNSLPLPFDEPIAAVPADADEQARVFAVDPARNVVLEASAGTGKTRVLVERYVNLLRAGVDPVNILAITFTRKAAAEMRQRILARLREGAALSEADATLWRDLRERAGEIAISTIDAFCLSLLREFPLEADLEPGFTMADETEIPRFVEQALDRALRTCRGLAREREAIALVFAQLSERNIRRGLEALLNRRVVAGPALARFLERGPSRPRPARSSRTASPACATRCCRLREGWTYFSRAAPCRTDATISSAATCSDCPRRPVWTPTIPAGFAPRSIVCGSISSTTTASPAGR